MTSTSESILISRDGQELGTWSAAEVARMLEAGVLKPGDCFWREGMAEWSTLDRFAPPRPEAKTFAVRFGKVATVDKIGFVGAGEIRFSADAVELVGLKHWPVIGRVGVFLVAAPLCWFLIGVFMRALPLEGGALLMGFKAFLSLLAAIGVPVLVMTLIHYLCASPAGVRLDKSAIADVTSKGSELSFTAWITPQTRRRAKLRANNEAEAAGIAHRLGQEPADLQQPPPVMQNPPLAKMKVGVVKSASGAIAGAVVLLFVALHWLGVFAPKPPAPQEVLERIKAEVENNGPQAEDRVRVTTIVYDARLSARERQLAGIPADLVAAEYFFRLTRTRPSGARQFTARAFFVWQERDGAWRFAENSSFRGAVRED